MSHQKHCDAKCWLDNDNLKGFVATCACYVSTTESFSFYVSASFNHPFRNVKHVARVNNTFINALAG